MEPNLAGSIYVRSSMKLLHFVPFRQQIWQPRTILVSDWLLLNKSSPLKLLGQIEPNLAGSIYVRSSIKCLHFVPFCQQIWLPRAILVSDWLL
jgi:acetyl-CoA carboxylase carboxyltransferase component